MDIDESVCAPETFGTSDVSIVSTTDGIAASDITPVDVSDKAIAFEISQNAGSKPAAARVKLDVPHYFEYNQRSSGVLSDPVGTLNYLQYKSPSNVIYANKPVYRM